MLDHFPYWTMDSWGSDAPPENAEEIIDRVNELWELYCATGRIM